MPRCIQNFLSNDHRSMIHVDPALPKPNPDPDPGPLPPDPDPFPSPQPPLPSPDPHPVPPTRPPIPQLSSRREEQLDDICCAT